MAGQPLHLDQRPGRRRSAGPPPAHPGRAAVLGQPAGPVGGAGHGTGVPRGHRGPAGLGPASPVAVLPDLHPASLAQLAGAGFVHHRRLRRRPGLVRDRLPGRVGGAAAGGCGSRHPAGPRHGVLHRVPVRAGQGPGLVAEPAAGPSPGRAGRAGRRGRDTALRPLARPGARSDRGRGAAGRRRRRPRPARRRGDHRHPSCRARAPGGRRHDPGPVRPVLLAGPGCGRCRDRGAVDRRGRRPAGPARPAGLLACEHAYVQAGQSVPLA